ncbi:MAG: ABC transporter substrate-binding protein [Candidatus Competibacterales bacterium]
MKNWTRRDVLQTGAIAGGTLAAGGLWGGRVARAQPSLSYTPEDGASLRVLRWNRFVAGDEELWMENTRKFTEQTGVQVRVDNESWEDVRPKAAVAANVGSGPDIILGWYDDPHQYPDKLLDLTELCEYLGEKYDGWYDAARTYGSRDGQWIALPLGASGACVVYRESMVKAAGFEAFPDNTDDFLKLCQALHQNGTPAGMALGNAVGDGNTWCHWLLWAFGGKVVDEQGNVVLNSPETEAALNYAQELYKVFIPGTTSWLDANNNKAFLAEQLGLTVNGISVYYAAKSEGNPIAEDINHANLPIGPAGTPTELHLFSQAMVMGYTDYPEAAKEYLRFMWEKEQYIPWQQAALGYITQPLKAYEANPVWTEDPKHIPYRDCVSRMLTNGNAGPLGYASAAVMADYVVVNMVAEAASGSRSPKDAMARAARRAERYYRI